MNNETMPQPPHASEVGPIEEFINLDKKKDSALLSRQFSAYAPPSAWGSWVQVASHGGVISYNISYEPVGNTNVLGSVNYQGAGGQVSQQFNDSIDITTGNVWANVFVCFRGAPLGTAVTVTISP